MSKPRELQMLAAGAKSMAKPAAAQKAADVLMDLVR